MNYTTTKTQGKKFLNSQNIPTKLRLMQYLINIAPQMHSVAYFDCLKRCFLWSERSSSSSSELLQVASSSTKLPRPWRCFWIPNVDRPMLSCDDESGMHGDVKQTSAELWVEPRLVLGLLDGGVASFDWSWTRYSLYTLSGVECCWHSSWWAACSWLIVNCRCLRACRDLATLVSITDWDVAKWEVVFFNKPLQCFVMYSDEHSLW